jgi:hypothetical protein
MNNSSFLHITLLLLRNCPIGSSKSAKTVTLCNGQGEVLRDREADVTGGVVIFKASVCGPEFAARLDGDRV